jgi:peptidoglycan/xylan/chitin deacetylase (PgdA/CDA1 family)
MRTTTLLLLLALTTPALALEPIPEKLVVLTFDDASRSHVTVASPLLKRHGFGATFFVTEGFDFATNKRDYMTWDEIAQLHHDGFEIGNHTRDHRAPSAKDPKGTIEQLEAINARCLAHSIPRPVTFAYPGNVLDKDVLPILHGLGIKFARRGGAPEYPYDKGRGCAYEPGLDHPLLIPSAGDGRPGWTLDDFRRAVSQAKGGKIAVIQLHGVPDTAHSWVNTPTPLFESYVQYLADNGYRVVALRDLARYVDPNVVPSNPWGVIEDRKRLLSSGRNRSNSRPAGSDNDLRGWLSSMLVHHRYTATGTGADLGLTADLVIDAAK